MDHVRATIQQIAPVDSVEALEKASVAVRIATARFTGPGSAEIDGTTLRFRQALVATGASPAIPPIPGLSHVDYLTSDLKVCWSHGSSDEPVMLYSEVNDEGYEIRKVEVYRDGQLDYANAIRSTGTTQLSDKPMPNIKEIIAQAEFSPTISVLPSSRRSIEMRLKYLIEC